MGRATTVRDYLASAIFRKATRSPSSAAPAGIPAPSTTGSLPAQGATGSLPASASPGATPGSFAGVPVPYPNDTAATNAADAACHSLTSDIEAAQAGHAFCLPLDARDAAAILQSSAPATQDSALRTQHSGLAGEQVLCDQAIFTSVRSGMGEGYRVIAASPGVTAVEKVEITRRSPSHGGLCHDDPGAVGLESYALPTKRHCIAFCCYAGCEHTARGGQRVYTHVVILNRQDWRRFQANPVAVHAALARYVEATGPVLKPVSRLEKIPFTPPPPPVDLPPIDAAPASGFDTVDSALAAAADLLAGRQTILLDAPNPLRLLEKILLSIPLEMRETLDVSADVKFSPARKMRLVLTAEPQAELQRRIGAMSIQVRYAGATASQAGEPGTAGRGSATNGTAGSSYRPAAGEVSPAGAATPGFQGWEQLLRRWWREGRRQDIQRLTAELCRGVSSEALDRIAAICEHTDALEDLSAEGVQVVIARYAGGTPPTNAEQVLVQELLQKAADRLAELQVVPDVR